MSIDDRLRQALRPDEPDDGPLGLDPALLARIVSRAEQRRRVKVTAAVGALVVAVVLASLVPAAVRDRSDRGPSHRLPVPTPATITQLEDPSGDVVLVRPSPIDAPLWRTQGADRQLWLASLDGTGLRAQGEQVYDRAGIGVRAMSMSLQYGQITLRIGAYGQHEPELAIVRMMKGTYDVRGHLLLLRLRGVGTSTFRWTHVTSGPSDAGHQLRLAYVDSAGPPQYGAPPGVLLRMLLTSAYFSYHEGF